MSKVEIGDLKMTREALCISMSLLGPCVERDLLVSIVQQIDIMRPLGFDGKHGTLHTPYCGCDMALHVAKINNWGTTELVTAYTCKCYLRRDHHVNEVR